MTITIIVKMTAVTLGYVLITGLLWRFCHRDEKLGRAWKLLIGLIYGACSVAANHFGIAQGSLLILNVRDIGPLAAGLFFSPLSGVLAGVIGGAERILAGEIWGIGKYTEIACGMSTFLAGLIAAILNRKLYQGRRPPMTQAFFIGAVTEVFHMYAILFTNRSSLNLAYIIVQEVAVPMIVFTAIGLTLCSMAVMKLAKEPSDLGLRMEAEKIPITVLFQRALLMVTVVLFGLNFVVSYNLETRLVTETAENELENVAYQKRILYEETEDLDKVVTSIENTGDYFLWFFVVDAETGEVFSPTGVLAENISVTSFSQSDMEQFRAIADDGPRELKLTTLRDMGLRFSFLAKVYRGEENRLLIFMREMLTVFSVRDNQIYESTLSDILLFTVMYMLVALLVDRLVVRKLHRVNGSLRKITGGDLNETVQVRTNKEFSDLSEDINKTVAALRGYIEAAKQQIKEELKMAALIQDSALPKNFKLPSDNIELYALMTPAKTVGGDFYDFFYINTDYLCLVIADVSGKGVPASLFMMRAKTAIKNYARTGMGPAELLKRANNTLCEGNDAEMFVTVWLGILDLNTGLMKCSNAGHEYPVLMRAGGEYELLKDRHGLVLAAMENVPVREYEIQLNPGDRLMVYTDGVPEAINEKNEAYGTQRLVRRLNLRKDASQELALEDVLRDLRSFAGNAEQFDDITMLGLTYIRRGGEA